MSGETQKIFFSYAREDAEFVLKLAGELRAAGADLWVDQLEILAGQHWDRAVQEALKSCPRMLLVLSPDSVESDNVWDEVSYALGERKPVIPVLHRLCEIPIRWRRLHYVDFTDDYEVSFTRLLRDLGTKQPSVAPPETPVPVSTRGGKPYLANRPVTSREYKLILKGDTFKELGQGVDEFWGRIQTVTQKLGGEVVQADQDEILGRRTWYLDTKAFDLRNQYNLVLRVREELSERVYGILQEPEEEKFKITLKFRDPDRWLSANWNVSVSKAAEVKKDNVTTKFEEDILPPFRSKFSLSTSVKLKQLPPAFTPPEDPEKPITTMKQVVAFFPGLADLDLPESTPIYVVRNFVAHEWAYRVGKLKFDKKIKVCLSFWYDSNTESDVPTVAEFSFDYDVSKSADDKVLEQVLDETLNSVSNDEEADSIRKIFSEHFPKGVFLEDYAIGVAAGARRLFEAMQEEAGIDLKGTTKTAFAYESPHRS